MLHPVIDRVISALIGRLSWLEASAAARAAALDYCAFM